MVKEKKLLTSIDGLEPSESIREKLKGEKKPVLVSFSCGKDAICTELALRESGVETKLAYLYYIPGLKFIQDGIDSLEQQLQKKIHRYPHPSLNRWLNAGIFQTPERAKIIQAAQLPEIEYADLWALIREDLGLPEDTWLADGVRANDSIKHRIAFKKYGAMKPNLMKVSPIWDWSKAMITKTLTDNGIQLPVDHELFGRSFDGLDRRFTEPIRERFPDDFELIKRWFPLVEVEGVRHGL